MRSFSTAWITGSSNCKVSNIIDHATSEVHKVDDVTKAQMEKKFNLCFVMAKEGIPFAKYPALLDLEQRHAVDVGHAYHTTDSAKQFTTYIARSQRQEFLNTLPKDSFFSLLMDGTTDVAVVEDEVIVIVYCNIDDVDEEITSNSRFLSLHIPQKADANGLLACVRDAMYTLGVENAMDSKSVLAVDTHPVLVGIGTDGASVNLGAHNGLRGQIQNALPWLFWSWCYAHRLELAYKAAFSSPLFQDLEEMLLRLYYLYEKSAKKARELEAIADDLRQFFELSKGGSKPVRCSGTRWVTHKRKAMQRLVDRYGVYIAHILALAEDTSVKATDRARLKGYLAKWKKPAALVGCVLYIDVLKPLSILSLTLQGDKADIVCSMENTVKSVKLLQQLKQKDPKIWPQIQSLKNSIKEVNGEQQYQGFPIENLDNTVDQCKVHVLADLQRLEEEIRQRLEWTDVNLLQALLVFLETQNWQRRDSISDTVTDGSDDVGMADIRASLEYIVSIFRTPLQSRGVCLATIQDELEEAVSYARSCLPIGRENYKKNMVQVTCVS